MEKMTWLQRIGERLGLYRVCPEEGRMMWLHPFRSCACDWKDGCRW